MRARYLALATSAQRDRLSPELLTGRLLLVSPHLDDAALSCGALLARTDPVDVLTVFAGQPDPPQQGAWDRLTGYSSSDHSVPARLAEDRAAFSGSPHRVTTLPLLELQHITEPRPSSDSEVIAREVRSWLEQGPGTVAIPAGAGFRAGRLVTRLERMRRSRVQEFHPDHVFVRDAVVATVCDEVEVPILLYEELPYLWGRPADREVAGISTVCGRTAQPVIVTVDRRLKADRIAAYESQLPHLLDDGSRLDDPDSLPPKERYWWLAPRADRLTYG